MQMQLQTPKRSPRRIDAQIFSSLLVEHDSFIGGDGLLTFYRWLDKEYKVRPELFKESPFDEAYHILDEHRITVDILTSKTTDWYRNEGVASGTAERMARSFREMESAP
jgi:hypothetical protein